MDERRSVSPLPMLPLPGSPASSWAIYKARFKAVFEGADLRVCAAFWLFGLINNVLYVIILSAALDLVGPRVPKGVVLLADVLPSFFTKLIAPYFIHTIPYSVRIFALVALSIGGMLLVALTPITTDGGTITTKMAGVVLASLSSGGGELSFLSLTHFYGPFSLAAWGSGTGGAGLVGAGAYVIATTSLGLSVRTSLLAFSFLPVIMLASFFLVLPSAPLNRAARGRVGYSVVAADERGDNTHIERRHDDSDEEERLLSSSVLSTPSHTSNSASRNTSAAHSRWLGFKRNLKRSRSLFFP
ncbi:MAG: battenin CLN3 protein [Sarea resinae]|nr:MAG: battenin CLN3 protein [Sarea resinae]